MVNRCNHLRRSKTSSTQFLVLNTRKRSNQISLSLILKKTKIQTTKTLAPFVWRTYRVDKWWKLLRVRTNSTRSVSIFGWNRNWSALFAKRELIFRTIYEISTNEYFRLIIKLIYNVDNNQIYISIQYKHLEYKYKGHCKWWLVNRVK